MNASYGKREAKLGWDFALTGSKTVWSSHLANKESRSQQEAVCSRLILNWLIDKTRNNFRECQDAKQVNNSCNHFRNCVSDRNDSEDLNF